MLNVHSLLVSNIGYICSRLKVYCIHKIKKNIQIYDKTRVRTQLLTIKIRIVRDC